MVKYWHVKCLTCPFPKHFAMFGVILKLKNSSQNLDKMSCKITSFGIFLIQNGSCAMVNTQYDSQDMIEDIILDFFVSNRNVKI